MTTRRTDRRELAGLGLLLALSLAAHAACVLRGLGEQDQARFCNDALIWHGTGALRPDLADYRPWTSPLYLHTLKACLDAGLSVRALATAMNWSSVAAATLTLVPMYALVRALAGAGPALATCVLYSFVPSFWIAGLYGMPHLPSFGLFLAALVLFAGSLGTRGMAWALRTAGAALALWLAVALKADVVLLGGAFLGVMLCKRRVSVRGVASALAIGLVAVAATYLHARAIVPASGSAAAVGADLDARLPLRPARLLGSWNLEITVASFGPVLLGASMAALAYCGLVGRKHWRLAALALLWSLPPWLVWGVKFGNSGRHMMAPAFPLVMLVGVSLWSLARGRRWAPLAVAVLVAANYAAGTRSASTVVPSTRLFESVADMQRAVDAWQAGGRQFASLRAERKFFLGIETNAYVLHEVLAGARSFEFTGRGHELRVVAEDGTTQLVDWAYVFGESDLDEAWHRAAEGWVAWSMEPRLQRRLRSRR